MGGVGERFTRVGVLGFELGSADRGCLRSRPILLLWILAMLRSRGLFSEVGVSQLFESEKLLCCLRRNFSRLLATMPSHGDRRLISESMGRFDGGSRGVCLSACCREDLQKERCFTKKYLT